MGTRFEKYLAAVVQAAHEWHVRRVTIASAPVVYNGIGELPWRDDQPLSMTAAFSMEVAKKCGEIVANYLGHHLQVECVEMRLPAMYGPNYDPRAAVWSGGWCTRQSKK